MSITERPEDVDLPDFIHLDGHCQTCGKRWGGTFTKRELERKVQAFDEGIYEIDESECVLPCGHPLGWTEADYRATLDVFNAAGRLIDEKKEGES